MIVPVIDSELDRKLMGRVGGQLIVLESQSNSCNPFCRLEIRTKGESVEDLISAHQRGKQAKGED